MFYSETICVRKVRMQQWDILRTQRCGTFYILDQNTFRRSLHLRRNGISKFVVRSLFCIINGRLLYAYKRESTFQKTFIPISQKNSFSYHFPFTLKWFTCWCQVLIDTSKGGNSSSTTIYSFCINTYYVTRPCHNHDLDFQCCEICEFNLIGYDGR